MHHNEEYIGVDYGSARVGLARGSSLAGLAEPLKTVAAAEAVEEIKQLAKVNRAAGIVVGLPRSLDGDETSQTKAIISWVDQLKKQLKLTVYWQDEALTSVAASEANDIDAAAAALILQDFLDSAENDRVVA